LRRRGPAETLFALPWVPAGGEGSGAVRPLASPGAVRPLGSGAVRPLASPEKNIGAGGQGRYGPWPPQGRYGPWKIKPREGSACEIVIRCCHCLAGRRLERDPLLSPYRWPLGEESACGKVIRCCHFLAGLRLEWDPMLSLYRWLLMSAGRGSDVSLYRGPWHARREGGACWKGTR